MTLYSLPGNNMMAPYNYSRFNNATIHRPVASTTRETTSSKKNNTAVTIASIGTAAVLAFVGRKKIGPLINKLGQLFGKGGAKISELGTKFADLKTPTWLKDLPGKISKTVKGAWEGAKKAGKAVGEATTTAAETLTDGAGI